MHDNKPAPQRNTATIFDPTRKHAGRSRVARLPASCFIACLALVSCSEDNGAGPVASGGSSSGAHTAGIAGGGTSGGTGAMTAGAGGTPAGSGGVNAGVAGAIGISGASMGGTSGTSAASGMGGMNANMGGAGGAVAGAAGSNAGGAGGAGGKSSAGAAGIAGMSPGTAGASGGPTLPPITDYTQKGSFATAVNQNVGPGGTYTVFRPEPLGQNGFLHAPIVFGPGIGQSVTVHTTMLTNFASHGFVVIGTPVLSGGPGDAGNRMSMQKGLEWIIQQNDAEGMYKGKIYVNHAISMGFSVGGTAAVEIGGHEAVATVVSIHGHGAMAALHGPMLQTTGTQDTVGMPLQQQTYDKSQVQTFLATLTGAPHAYIEQNGGGQERPAILAWMRYWIYRDEGARGYFYGDDCVLCRAPWENPKRKNWQ